MKFKIQLLRKVTEVGTAIVEAADEKEAGLIADKINIADARLSWEETESETLVGTIEQV
jgi:hypothetical protein